MNQQTGLTLVELLVVMVIITILASVAMPYVEITVQRDKEIQLKRSLRMVRVAIDRFHEDWQEKRLSSVNHVASDDGYPVNLTYLVDGVDLSGSIEGKRYYLRRIPRNPFAKKNTSIEEQWILRGYRDAPDALSWNNQDVYDIRVGSSKIALDGTTYDTW